MVLFLSRMRKIFLFIAPLFLALGLFFTIAFFLNQNKGKGALQVTANPRSKVYVDGKLIGTTPLCKCEVNDMIAVGDYTVRVEPEDSNYTAFEEKVTISKSILTVVDRTFAKGVASEGSIISLTPLDKKDVIQLLVITFPDKAQVYVDNSPSGVSPLLLNNLTESDHEILIKKDGYRDKTVRIRTVTGYKLTVIAYLGVNTAVAGAQLTPTLSPQASPSATPTQVISRIVILQTPTGFLRVRETPSAASAEVGRVNPGETYELVAEENGWFEIKLTNGQLGWISAQYAQKQ